MEKTKRNIADYTKNFQNWFDELASESEGASIIRKSSLEQLETLFTRCTGQSPLREPPL